MPSTGTGGVRFLNVYFQRQPKPVWQDGVPSASFHSSALSSSSSLLFSSPLSSSNTAVPLPSPIIILSLTGSPSHHVDLLATGEMQRERGCKWGWFRDCGGWMLLFKWVVEALFNALYTLSSYYSLGFSSQLLFHIAHSMLPPMCLPLLPILSPLNQLLHLFCSQYKIYIHLLH